MNILQPSLSNNQSPRSVPTNGAISPTQSPTANPAHKAQLRRFERAVMRGTLANPQCRATVMDAGRNIQHGHKVLDAAALFGVLLDVAPEPFKTALRTPELTLFDKSWHCLRQVLLESRPRNARHEALEWQFALAAAAALTGATPVEDPVNGSDHAANGANGATSNNSKESVHVF